MMNAETWMSAQEAVDKGFATCVEARVAAVKNTFDLTRFRNAPAPVVEEPVVEPVVEEPVVEAVVEPDLSLFEHQLEINRRK